MLLKIKQNAFQIIFFLLLPFVFFDSLWVIRNFINEDKFIPSQSTVYAGEKPSKSFIAYRKFISKVGEDPCEWEPGSLGHWFQPNEYLRENDFITPKDNLVPNYLYFDKYDLNHFKKIRSLYWKCYNTKNIKSNEDNFIFATNNYLKDFKRKKPIHYYLFCPIRRMYKFTFQPYTYYMQMSSGSLKYLQYPVKVLMYVVNTFIFIFGYFSLMFHLIKNNRKTSLFNALIMFIPIFTLFVFPLYLGLIEYRFHILAIPSIVLMIGIFISDPTLNWYLTKK